MLHFGFLSLIGCYHFIITCAEFLYEGYKIGDAEIDKIYGPQLEKGGASTLAQG